MRTLADKIKEGVKAVRKTAVVGAVSLGIGASLLGSNAKGATVINSFDDLIPDRSSTSKYMQMDYGDNLTARDPNTLEDSVVEKDGSVWHIGFVKYVPEVGAFVGGSASNDNGFSNTFPGYEGWCDGRVYSSVFSEGDRADGIMVAHDPDGGQMALFYFDGRLVFDDNINFYSTGDIEINGVQGDLNQLPQFTFQSGNGPNIPHMVINPPSGPVLRQGPYDANDLADFAYYWLSGCDESNDYCEGLDFIDDGAIDFKDFAHLANDWTPSESGSKGLSSMYSEKMTTDVYSTTQDANGVYQVGDIESDYSYAINSLEFGDGTLATLSDPNSLERAVSE